MISKYTLPLSIVSVLVVTLLIFALLVGIGISNDYLNLLNLDKLAKLGDFLGGLFNPVLSLINIIIFISLTYQIHNYNQNQDIKSIARNKLLNLNQLKYSEFNYFTEEMDKAFDIWKSDIQNINQLKNIQDKYELLSTRIGHLFPTIKGSKENKEFLVELMIDLSPGNILLENEKYKEEQDDIFKLCQTKYSDVHSLLIKEFLLNDK